MDMEADKTDKIEGVVDMEMDKRESPHDEREGMQKFIRMGRHLLYLDVVAPTKYKMGTDFPFCIRYG